MSESLGSSDGLGPIVSVEWLQKAIDQPGVRVIDARPFGQYAQGHLPGASSSDQNSIRLPDSSPESIARFEAAATAEVRRLGLQRTDKVIFYEEMSGSYAARGVWMLDYLGFSGGAMLDGGLIAWVHMGGEMTLDEPGVEPSQVEIEVDPDVLATAGSILEGIDGASDGIAILDTRSVMELRMGTIPTSIHIDWLRNLDERGLFRPREELDALYRAAGLDPASPRTVVPFCGSGYRAAHAYVVLKALGYGSVKNYAPSWSEWGRRPELPVERSATS